MKSHPQEAERHGLSRAKVDEWLHADKGKPWARAGGGSVMDALATAQRYAAGGSSAPASPYLAGTAGGSAANISALPTYVPAQAGGTGSPAAMGINPHSGLMTPPQSGTFVLDPNTGALTSYTQAALRQLAMRGLSPPPAAAPATTTPSIFGPAMVNAGSGSGGAAGGHGVPGMSTTAVQGIAAGQGSETNAGAAAAVGAASAPGDATGTPGGGVGGAAGFAMGGMPSSQASPWWERSDSRQMDAHPAGLIQGPSGGRADHVPMSVGSGSYVVPADVVSGVGGGNTMAGGHALDSMMRQGPYGTKIPVLKAGHANLPKPPAPPRFAQGGAANGVPVLVSHGEYIYPPHEVAHMGGGDVKRGHELLDKWVVEQRKENVRKTAALPGPVKS